MDTIVYCRVSTIDQHPENQAIELKRYCENLNIQDYTLVEERESTRKTRPLKNDVIKGIREGRYRRVIVWSLFRWARTLEELMSDLNMLETYNIEFHSIKDLGIIDTSTAWGKAQVHLIGVFGQFERDRIRERTMLGLDRARAEGTQLGRPKGAKDKKKRRTAGYSERYRT